MLLNADRQSELARARIDGQSRVGERNGGLEPTPPAIITAAAENQYKYDYYQKCR